MSRKIISICIVVLLLLTCCHTALAAGFDPSKSGSVSVTLADQGEPMVGAQLRLYYVAAASADANGNITYTYTEEFKAMEVPLEEAADALDAFIAQRSLPFKEAVTDGQGKAAWAELPLGLYYVCQAEALEGFAPCKPFLLTLPSEQKGEYLYEIDATPKTEAEKYTAITVKKVWNTNASTPAAKQVTIQLLDGEKVIETAILNAENNWQRTFSNLPKSDGYSVREIEIPKGFTATYQQDGAVFTVTNTATLIQTGQLVWPIPALAIGGMLLIAVGALLLRKKRDCHE